MITGEARLAIYDLFADYVNRLDGFRLDDWLALFVDGDAYCIVPREDHAATLPLSLMLCNGKDMMRDRAVALWANCTT